MEATVFMEVGWVETGGREFDFKFKFKSDFCVISKVFHGSYAFS